MTKFKNPVNRYELSQKEDKVIIKFYNTNNEEEDFLELGIGSKPQKDTKWKKTLKSFDDIEYLNSWVKDIQQLIVDLYKPGSFNYKHSRDRVHSFLEGRIKNINKNIKNAGKE